MSTLDGKSILVTGGTGSFGQAFVRTVLERCKPKRLAIFSRDELKQSQMAMDPRFANRQELRFLIGDVRDKDRLAMAMRGIDTVIHAAAMKQVPTAEYNPFECLRTNVWGAENVVRAALDTGVKRVLALSTDKAANPINLYGASKLAAEKIFVAANNLSGGTDTRFSVVRYGNVLGSRGSVLPLFQRLIAEGAKELPVTDERMTRFWITLQQGVDFVLSSMSMMRGGEIFVPRIPSMTVVDMAKAVAPELPVKVIGIRPGEKLHEVLMCEDEARLALELDDRFIIEPAFSFWRSKPYADRGANRVSDGFAYTSNTNTMWMSIDQLRDLLQRPGALA